MRAQPNPIQDIRRHRGLAVVLGLALSLGLSLHAHEIGTTRVHVVLQGNRYQVEIFTDAAVLLEKLDAFDGSTASSSAVQRSMPASLAAHDEAYRQRLVVMFDGQAVQPKAEYAVQEETDATAPLVAVVRLSGEIPSGAREFRWSYAWTFASYALTIKNDGARTVHTAWLDGDETSQPFSLANLSPGSDVSSVAWRYLVLGATHIVPHGLDHVLFVLGLFLLSSRIRPLLWQVSAFTLAHSITLGLSIYDLVAVPTGIVEPLIALSIAYVAIENVFQSELKSWRVAVVFAFGLLHGLGFAGALREVGLDTADLLTALVTFNLGVEAGQIAVVTAAFLLVGLPARMRPWYRQRIAIPASVGIACVALYWTVERLVS